MSHRQLREELKNSNRVVVKAGTRVLVRREGRPDPERMQALVQDLAALKRGGREVILVSSGAVGAGMDALGLKTRPTLLPELQMAAAVGQNRLMSEYEALFRKEGLKIGQLLLTHDDLNNRKRHINARNTLQTLLHHDIIPIINENDVIATEEIRFGDNDQLAALVAMLIDADVLIMLTTANGLRESMPDGRTRRVPHVEQVTEKTLALVRKSTSNLGSGGMTGKLESARMAADMGIPVVIADGRRTGTVRAVLEGQDRGTLIGTPGPGGRALPSRKRWIAFFHRAAGTLEIDDGARRALEEAGKSLLPIGITNVIGDFMQGSMVNIRDGQGELVARGLTDYSSADIRVIQGKPSDRIADLLGHMDYRAVVHRDNMYILTDRSAH